MKQFKLIISFLWQFPLAVVSFCFFKTMRWLIVKYTLQYVKKRFKHDELLVWRELSEWQTPKSIRNTMVTGPRWNCHAFMCVVGPFKVKSNIEIQVETARKSAKQWTCVIYVAGHQKRSFVSSMTASKNQSWHKIDLKESDSCSIVLRYYNVEKETSFPAIKIDGVQRINSKPFAYDQRQQCENHLNKLRNHRTLFYFLLHYYVFVLLQYKKWFPEKFVKKEYLPMGNPETVFLYGSIKKGEVLYVDFNSDLLNAANFYITVLNVCSFPVFWETITMSKYRTPRILSNGTYLIRIHYKDKKFLNEVYFGESNIHCETRV